MPLEDKHEMKHIDTSSYTQEYWFNEIHSYLVDVMSMNNKQVKAEFLKRFPDLLNRGLDI